MTPRMPAEISDSLIERMLLERAAPSARLGLAEEIVAAAAATPQRRRPAIWVAGGARRGGPFIAAWVAAALVLLAIALAIVGPGRDWLAAIDPSTPSPSTSLQPGPSASAPASRKQLVAFIRSIRTGTPDQTEQLWVVSPDGGDAHPLLPELTGDLGLGGWSGDGRRLVFTRGTFGALDDRLYLTDRAGTTAAPVDTGCLAPCLSESGPTLSRDGQRVLFIRHYAERSVVAWIDLASLVVTELDETRMAGIASAEWSPDETQISFASVVAGQTAVGDKATTYVVAADGTDLHHVTPPQRAYDPHWAPDGSTILVSTAATTIDGLDRRDTYDIALVRPDGSDFKLLTTDGRSGFATWLPDGRVRFARLTIDGLGSIVTWEWWSMDADGRNAGRLDLPQVIQEQIDAAWPLTP